ncbi:ferrochelatase [Thermomonas alba]|uniref:ferrochelatase n=1 Tax=Thermomonas alba TaxID=2888525 RepID=UPI001F035197|nr:ferrochelatase [Thermomonas alba]
MQDDTHAAASATPPALLLVNLGTPAAPTARAVRKYLSQFLHDYRIVPLTRWLWCPLLHFLILPLRSPKVARKYAQIWMEGGSPLAVHTAALAAAVGERLPGWQVRHAMRYGEPSVAAVLSELRAQGVRRVRVLPLYPQYSTTTTASVEDALAAAVPGSGLQVELRCDYHVDPGWVAAVADSIRAHWRAHGIGERLLLSFHGIPRRLVEAGDPYAAQCEASAAAIASALGIARDELLLTFQSRFGREPWLEPSTQPTLEALARQGVRTVDVICPGFAVDCLETLEEIALENAAAFRAAGGRALRYIPCLNAAPAHADALAALARAQEGWA